MSDENAQRGYIRTQRIRIEQEIAAHQASIDNLRAELKTLRHTCPHSWGRVFEGDPAGGHDSCFICNICKGAF